MKVLTNLIYLKLFVFVFIVLQVIKCGKYVDLPVVDIIAKFYIL